MIALILRLLDYLKNAEKYLSLSISINAFNRGEKNSNLFKNNHLLVELTQKLKL